MSENTSSTLEFITAAEAERAAKRRWYREERDAVIDAINTQILKTARTGEEKLVILGRLRKVYWHRWFRLENVPIWPEDILVRELDWVVPELERKGFRAKLVVKEGGWFSAESAKLTITWGGKVPKKHR